MYTQLVILAVIKTLYHILYTKQRSNELHCWNAHDMTFIPFTKKTHKKNTFICVEKWQRLLQAIRSALSPKGAGVRCGNKHYPMLFESMTVYNIFRRKHSHLVPYHCYVQIYWYRQKLLRIWLLFRLLKTKRKHLHMHRKLTKGYLRQ